MVHAVSIATHPRDKVLECYGCKVTLSISTTATEDNTLTYQWFKDGMVITPKLYPYCRQYDTPNLVITPFMPEYEGKYKCRISNEIDMIESNEAKIICRSRQVY